VSVVPEEELQIDIKHVICKKYKANTHFYILQIQQRDP